MSASNGIYADILLPLALENTYTYLIPEDLAEKASFGMRVEVQFGARKRYAGLIVRMGVRAPEYRTKEIISILDQEPVILPGQYKIWQWMAGYYCCTLGEVMKAALPGALLLSSETIIKAMPVPEDDVLQLGEPLYMLFRIIEQRTSITLEDLQKASGLKALYPHIVKLYQLGMILVVEELEEKYIPKKIKLVGLGDAYRSEEGLQQILEEVAKSEKQTHVVLSYLALAGKDLPDIDPKAILTRAEVGKGVLQTLIQKGIFKEVTKEVNRMDRYGKVAATAKAILTPVQEKALQQIQHQWKEKEVVLLHGVTGSGKTIIYTEIIQEVINQGGQVLYLLPEIGMSVQLLSRFKEIFGLKDYHIAFTIE